MRRWYDQLSAYERESFKDTLLAAFGGACVLAALVLSGVSP
ncbi:MAG: hypothetical protein ACREO3_07705 [Arenimonas sp.]